MTSDTPITITLTRQDLCNEADRCLSKSLL